MTGKNKLADLSTKSTETSLDDYELLEDLCELDEWNIQQKQPVY